MSNILSQVENLLNLSSLEIIGDMASASVVFFFF